MKRWFQLGRARIAGARVYVHWSVLAVMGLLALVSFNSPIHAAVSIASYLAIIFIHEIGHALMARRLGYEVVAIRVAFLHGHCEFEAPYTASDDVLIAWAGVLAQLAVAVPVLVMANLLEERDLGYAAPAVVFLGYVNILCAFVNLAPSPYSDGHTAWRVIPLLREWWTARRSTKRVLHRMTRRR